MVSLSMREISEWALVGVRARISELKEVRDGIRQTEQRHYLLTLEIRKLEDKELYLLKQGFPYFK